MSSRAPLQFNRPVEYDPSLARSTPSGSSNSYKTKEEKLNDELGFEDEDSDNEKKKKKKKKKKVDSDSDGANSSDDDNDNSPKKKKNSHKKSLTNTEPTSSDDDAADNDDEKYGADEMEKLIESLQEANEAKMRAETERIRAEERFDELKRVSTHAQKILVEKFNTQIKRLQTQITEMKGQQEDDDEMMEALKEQNQLLQAAREGKDVDDDEINNKLKEFKDIREYQRENLSLKYKIEELKNNKIFLEEENEKKEKELIELKKKISTNPKEVVDELKKKVEQLETEKSMFKDEIKKRHVETTKLVAKIKKLQEEKTTTGDDLETNSSTNAKPVPATTAATASPATTPAKATITAEKETELLTKIKNLEEQVSKATTAAAKSAAEVASANARAESSAAAAASATAAAAKSSSAKPAPVAAGMSLEDKSKLIEEKSKLAEEKSKLVEEKSKLLEEKTKLEEVIRKMDTLMKRREEEMQIVKDKAKEKLTTASNAITKLKNEYATLRTAFNKQKLDSSQTEMFWREKLIESVRKRKKVFNVMSEQLSNLKDGMNELKGSLEVVTNIKDTLKGELEKAFKSWENRGKAEIKHLKEAYQKELKLRKQYFNMIQELKGNIRVYARIRPLLDKENGERKDMEASVSFPQEEEIVIKNDEKKTTHNFQFEKIFTPASTQMQVFDEVKDLIGSVLDGYNVCIFAYGQTGSGKTHTMEGYRDDPGVNIRALTRLFDGADERRDDFGYTFDITLLEIYNERIQDLLGEGGGKILKPKTGQYGMEVPDLIRIRVSNKDQVLTALKRGSKNRHVQSTAMNDTSSRSHLILSVYVLGKSKLLNREVMGKLHLIDLAGSERVGRSGATGETLKEAQHINQSLSALGNVIHARANKAGHVPYRDSTLTHLLQDSLDKNSKTLMFVQISPSPLDSGESLQSLRFASRVREVELGKAEANVSKAPAGAAAAAPDTPARPPSAKPGK